MPIYENKLVNFNFWSSLMKRLILGISVLLLLTVIESQAFESGIYRCGSDNTNSKSEDMFDALLKSFGKTTIILKANGRVKQITKYKTIRGYWQDDDDAAIGIKNDWIIVDKGNGNYTLGDNPNFSVPCKKITKKALMKIQKDERLAEQKRAEERKKAELEKAKQKKAKLEKEIKDRREAQKQKRIKYSKEKAKQYANEWTTGPLSTNMSLETKKRLLYTKIVKDFEQQDEETKPFIIDELNSMNVYIPSVNANEIKIVHKAQINTKFYEETKNTEAHEETNDAENNLLKVAPKVLNLLGSFL